VRASITLFHRLYITKSHHFQKWYLFSGHPVYLHGTIVAFACNENPFNWNFCPIFHGNTCAFVVLTSTHVTIAFHFQATVVTTMASRYHSAMERVISQRAEAANSEPHASLSISQLANRQVSSFTKASRATIAIASDWNMEHHGKK